MKNNIQTYEEVEDFIIDTAIYTVNSQKEDILKEYKIAYEDDCEIDIVSIIKKKDKYIVNVNGIKGELKRDNKELPKLMLKIFDLFKLNQIDKISKNLLEQYNKW